MWKCFTVGKNTLGHESVFEQTFNHFSSHSPPVLKGDLFSSLEGLLGGGSSSSSEPVAGGSSQHLTSPTAMVNLQATESTEGLD